ncbi:MAG: glutamate--tRNA ligase [Gemmatimonadetes bacterium]|nr:glutamate--tRNA ligase [Gemmatimonadota bacterium]
MSAACGRCAARPPPRSPACPDFRSGWRSRSSSTSRTDVVRTRFAPSPTGALHVGNARMAVLNWLFTRKLGGQFILRIEDTDRERNVPGAEEGICDDLSWLGLDWDEGPGCRGYPERGSHGPYRQTERAEYYREHLERLRAAGAVYPCFCSDAQLEEERQSALEEGTPLRYGGRCRALSAAETAARAAAGAPFAWRFRVPDREVLVRDLAYGEVRVPAGEIGDFIVLRSDGQPTYNFAVVVDDITMGVTHVVRGVGHLSNTPRQVLLYQALGIEPPVFAHVPTVLGPDRQKLSKRRGATSIAEYRAQGYHPDALVNYLSLLSWSSPSGEEVLGRAQLIEQVSLDRIGVADVVFDGAKLRFLSARHIERMPLPELLAAVEPFLDPDRQPIAPDLLPVAVAAVRTHLTTFADIGAALSAFFPGPDAAPPVLDAAARPVLAAAREALRSSGWEEEALQAALKQVGTETGARGRALYEPLRLALTGAAHGPPFIPLLQVQGRELVLQRLREALAREN